MKTFNESFRKVMMVCVLGGLLIPTISFSNEIEEAFDSEPLDIEGTWQQKESPSEKMAKVRQRLEKKTNDLMQKKIEDIRYKEEMKLTRKLQKAFTGGLQSMDEVKTQSSAVQKTPEKVVQKVVVFQPVIEEKKLKLIPSIGFYNLKSEDVDFDSKIAAGVSFESMINDRVSVGLGFRFSSMKLYDSNNSYNGFSKGFYNPYQGFNAPCFNNGYSNNCVNYNEREIDYKTAGLELNSKVFLITDAKIRPFVGGGVAYNRVNLKYNDNGNDIHYYYNNSNNALGGEEYSSTTITGSIILGTEVKFTENVGLNFDFRISKGLSTGSSAKRQANTMLYNPDLDRLENIADDIEASTLTGINLGLLVTF